MRTLRQLGLDERTLIIFTSDNGGATHFRATDNRPLASGKGRPYEGGIRVPLLMRWPGQLRPGTVVNAPVTTVDLLPTICAAVDAEVPADLVLDGVDLLPIAASGGGLAPRALHWHYPHYWWGDRVTPYSIIRRGRWKLIRWWETGELELFDLTSDVGEETNLAESNPDMANRLADELDTWLEATGARLPEPNPDFDPDA